MTFFSAEGLSPYTTPYPLDAYGASPLLAEILNTPLDFMFYFIVVVSVSVTWVSVLYLLF